jgi:hypothetical protein
MSFTVVYAKDTRQVLGALSVTGPAGPLPTIGALAGKQLPVRVGLSDGTIVELAVPASRLAVAAVDETPEALVRPFNYGVDPGPDDTPGSALLRLVDGLSVTLGAKGVTLTLTDNTSAGLPVPTSVELPVLVAVAGDGQVHVKPWQIGQGESQTTVGMTLTTGKEYGVLALVQQWAGWLGSAPAT